MLTHFAQHYEHLWTHHWWWQSRKRFVLHHIHQLAAQRPLADILDIGCGNGLFFPELARFGSVRGIETDPNLVSDTGPYRAQIDVTPFGPAYPDTRHFDLILMLDVLEHIPDDRAAAQRAHDLLKPGGYFLLTVPAMMWLWSMHDVINQHHRRYTRATLRQVLESAGFKILKLHYFFAWTVPPMLLRRLLKPGQGNKDTYQVNVPHPLINKTMYALSRAEQLTLGRTGTLTGSSVLALAQKP